jgi:prephenate dehydrogenase
MKSPQSVLVIGCGLIGTSIALALREHDVDVHLDDVSRSNLELAVSRGAGSPEPLATPDLVVVAVPPSEVVAAVAHALETWRDAVVTDVASVKADLATSIAALPGADRYVGSHPMAGSERKGARFAKAELFDGATCIVTPTAKTPTPAATKIERLWQLVGMEVVRMTPAGHDKAVAAISHLPHLLSALMMLQPADAELNVSAGGFRDVTHLAGGDAEMWRDILLTNRKAILAGIDSFDEAMMELRDLLELGDSEGIEKFLTAARQRRQKHLGDQNGAGE